MRPGVLGRWQEYRNQPGCGAMVQVASVPLCEVPSSTVTVPLWELEDPVIWVELNVEPPCWNISARARLRVPVADLTVRLLLAPTVTEYAGWPPAGLLYDENRAGGAGSRRHTGSGASGRDRRDQEAHHCNKDRRRSPAPHGTRETNITQAHSLTFNSSFSGSSVTS